MHDSGMMTPGRLRQVLIILGLTLFVLVGSKAIGQADDRTFVDGRKLQLPIAADNTLIETRIFPTDQQMTMVVSTVALQQQSSPVVSSASQQTGKHMPEEPLNSQQSAPGISTEAQQNSTRTINNVRITN